MSINWPTVFRCSVCNKYLESEAIARTHADLNGHTVYKTVVFLIRPRMVGVR